MKKPNSNPQKQNKLVLKRNIIKALTSATLGPIRGGTDTIIIGDDDDDTIDVNRCKNPIYSA